jgi:hypothetical protein
MGQFMISVGGIKDGRFAATPCPTGPFSIWEVMDKLAKSADSVRVSSAFPCLRRHWYVKGAYVLKKGAQETQSNRLLVPRARHTNPERLAPVVPRHTMSSDPNSLPNS